MCWCALLVLLSVFHCVFASCYRWLLLIVVVCCCLLLFVVVCRIMFAGRLLFVVRRSSLLFVVVWCCSTLFVAVACWCALCVVV